MLRTATRAMAIAAVAVTAKDPKASPTPDQSLVCRPSDLPIYEPLRKPKPACAKHPEKESKLHETISPGVRYVRQGVQSGYKVVADQAAVVGHYAETAKAHTQRSIDMLNEPQNSLHRSGAIVIGGLAGFIFAARGGFFKKVVYTGIGAGAVASLCYPRQAEENCRVVLYEGRKVFAVAYNFIKGVKPGDEVPIEPISNFPTSFADLKHLALDLVHDAKDAIFRKKE